MALFLSSQNPLHKNYYVYLYASRHHYHNANMHARTYSQRRGFCTFQVIVRIDKTQRRYRYSSHLRTTLPKRSSQPLPASRPNHATLPLNDSKSRYMYEVAKHVRQAQKYAFLSLTDIVRAPPQWHHLYSSPSSPPNPWIDRRRADRVSPLRVHRRALSLAKRMADRLTRLYLKVQTINLCTYL